MQTQYITPLNLSKLGFRYFRIILESKLFSKKFISYLVNHPNTGYVFEGKGWSGKKRVLGIGIWATSNAEITDLATHIRSVIPDSYKVVYQSELTRLEYYATVDGERRPMVLIDELAQRSELSAIEKDFLKLISVDGSLTSREIATILGLSDLDVEDLSRRLQSQGVYYGVLESNPLPDKYTKFFIDTATLKSEQVEEYYVRLSRDPQCVYLARGNGKYNLEFEYIVNEREVFESKYRDLLTYSKQVTFEENVFTNLFPQSKSINSKIIQDTFIELAKTNDTYFDFRDSQLWYVNHEGANAYLDIYSDATYKESMKLGEVGLFSQVAQHLAEDKHVTVIDLGSGDGKKALELIHELNVDRVKAYFPVDIQELELAQALRTHKDALYTLHPTVLGFDKLATRFPLAGSNTETSLYVLLGGTYGNFPSIKINHYLEKILKPDDLLVIAMPISDYTSKETIEASYLNTYVEQVGFGVLKQIGFKREEFKSNETDARFILQPKWKDGAFVQSFTLKQNKHILGVSLEAGTEFDVMSSWKPSLQDFKAALEQTFLVETMFKNKSFAIAVCRKRGGGGLAF